MSVMTSAVFKRRRDAAIADFRKGLARWRFATQLAWDSLFSRVRLTSLGVVWLIIQPLIWMLAMIVLIQPNVSLPAHLYPTYVASGVVLFTGLTTMLGGGAQVFSREKGRIQNVPLPLSLFAFKTLILTAMEMLVTLPIVAGAMIYSNIALGPSALFVLPGLIIFFAFGFGATLILGTAAARYPSVILITQSLLRMLLFLTPIFWVPGVDQGIRYLIAHLNPLYHIISLVRDPLMGFMPSTLSYVIAGGTSFAVLIFGVIFFARFRERIAVWL
jgi:ABC-type polysaccharide/polyol phosphate export permease